MTPEHPVYSAVALAFLGAVGIGLFAYTAIDFFRLLVKRLRKR